MPVVKLGLASYKWQSLFVQWPIEGDSHGALISCKKMGGGGVPFWPDRYETPGVLYVSTFGLDTKSGLSGEVYARDTSSPAYDPP